MHRVVVAVLCSAVFAVHATAGGFMSGEDLHDLCNDEHACTAYVLGTLDTVDHLAAESGDGSPYCAAELESDTATELVIAFLKRHPAKWSDPAPKLVLGALEEEFPCGEQD